MTTFERVKTAILGDMAASQTHTAASWASIMLRNTCQLTDEIEQKKFWDWVANPLDEERPKSTFETITPATEQVVFSKTYQETVCDSDDEKCNKTVTMEQEVRRNGLACFIKVKPQK